MLLFVSRRIIIIGFSMSMTGEILARSRHLMTDRKTIDKTKVNITQS